MLADDLVGVVALEALGAVVPAAHVAFGVEHVDRVVAHALEQQAVVLLGVAQRAFRLLALGHVEADAEHADGGAAVVADHLADAVQMTNAAVRTHDALFVAEIRARLERGADACLHLRAIVGMDEADEFLERAAELIGAQAVDVEQLLGPGDPVVARCPTTSFRDWRAAALPSDGYWRRRVRRCARARAGRARPGCGAGCPRCAGASPRRRSAPGSAPRR